MVFATKDESRTRLSHLLRHVEGVARDCEILGERLIEAGEFDFGKDLIVNGRIHDASKFHGIEWGHLGVPGDPMHEEAWRSHVAKNAHHPEFWDEHEGIHIMDRLHIAEMVADWHQRSSEFGTDFRGWIKTGAMPRYGFTVNDKIYKKIKEFVDLLLEPHFV